MEEHKASKTVDKVSAHFMPLNEAMVEVAAQQEKTGISRYRFMQAIGGNGLLRPPFSKYFECVFGPDGKRYVKKASLNHLADLVKK